MERAKQQQIVTINRGLFLVRYAAAEDTAQPPVVRVMPDPMPNKDVGILLHPDQREPVLWQPETCLVVRASAPGKLKVEVIPSCEGGSAAATVKIETLSQGVPIPPAMAQPKPTSDTRSGPAKSGGIHILGHATGLGDQIVSAYQWLGGPSAPLRIEGIAIDWPDKPSELEIRYAVKTAKPQPGSGRAVGLGTFTGTRGKAMPIVSVMLEMSGAAAADLQFELEAIFLGAPAMRVAGKRVVASGPTGREPLVGLRLGLQNAGLEKPAAKVPATKSSASKGAADKSKVSTEKPSTEKPKEAEGRVRVFRPRPKPSQPTTA